MIRGAPEHIRYATELERMAHGHRSASIVITPDLSKGHARQFEDLGNPPNHPERSTAEGNEGPETMEVDESPGASPSSGPWRPPTPSHPARPHQIPRTAATAPKAQPKPKQTPQKSTPKPKVRKSSKPVPQVSAAKRPDPSSPIDESSVEILAKRGEVEPSHCGPRNPSPSWRSLGGPSTDSCYVR